jgi:hypothetical protein
MKIGVANERLAQVLEHLEIRGLDEPDMRGIHVFAELDKLELEARAQVPSSASHAPARPARHARAGRARRARAFRGLSPSSLSPPSLSSSKASKPCSSFPPHSTHNAIRVTNDARLVACVGRETAERHTHSGILSGMLSRSRYLSLSLTQASCLAYSLALALSLSH